MNFVDTVPTDLGGLGDAGPTTTSSSPQERLPLEFTGSGSEYFRIWLVNLLLTILTLSLYAPFARARRLSYFYANTRVGGHALGFHGDPWKMLRGHLLVLALAGAYALASSFSPLAAGVAALAFALLWPALWRASLQFRLSNTSWRGLRLGFDGSLAGAYLSLAPMLVPSLLLVLAWGGLTADDHAPPGWLLALSMLPVLLLPWAMAQTTRYQHGGYTFASETSRLDAGNAAFYLWALKVLGLGVLVALVVAALFGLLMVLGGRGNGLAALLTLVLVMLGYLLLFLLMAPFAAATLQNLVWGRTSSRRLRFGSQLASWAYIRLSIKNLALTALTLGMYRPFAAVAATRMRLQAVSLHVRGDLDQWVARAARRSEDVTADAAGDFFGIDLGL